MWIGCISCQNFQSDFVARIFALIAPIRPILHRVSSSNETVSNAPKHYEMHRNMSLGSNCVDRVCSLWRIPMRLHCTNFCINCTYSAILHWVSSSNKTVPNAPKLYEMHQNMSLGSNGVDRVNSLWKLRHNFVARTFALIARVRLDLHRVSCSNEMVPNAPKPLRNAQKPEFGIQWYGSGAFVAKNSDVT